MTNVSSNRLVRLARELAVIAFDVQVAVPGTLVLHAAGVDLDEADAPFDHPPGDQALSGEVVAAFVPNAVQVLNVLRLCVDIDCFGRRRLHAVRQFEALNPRSQLALGVMLLMVKLVELFEQVQLPTLGGGRHRLGRNQVVDRLPFGSQMRSLIDSRQEAGAPVGGVAFRQTTFLGIGHHHEGGQVLAFAPQPVRHPRADARIPHSRQAAVHHEQRRRMVVRFGKAGMNERHLVDVFAQVREQRGDHLAGLAAGSEFEGGLH
jgi:hypothetical protein